MVKPLKILLLSALALGAWATISARAAVVGISLPNDLKDYRWLQDGRILKEDLEAAGHEVLLEYAGQNNEQLQLKQIASLIEREVAVLLIAPVNCDSMGETLEQAKLKGIPIIAYDRLINGTDAISYYLSFDNQRIGVMQGHYLERQLGLEGAIEPRHLEIFSGDGNDSNAKYLYDGAMSVLAPYLKSGMLKVSSGETSLRQTAIKDWQLEVANTRMTTLIAKHGYSSHRSRLDAVLSPNDSIAQGVIKALLAAGYNQRNIPLVTGLDCLPKSVKLLSEGLQAMSAFKDSKVMAKEAVKMVNAITSGQEVDINDLDSYHNGAGPIPAVLLTPLMVTRDNVAHTLFDKGYFNEQDIKNLP